MDFKKVLQIALKDVRILYTDRSRLIITIIAPLALTLIIGAAFSGLSGGNGDVPIQNIGVGVVNNDQGTNVFGQQLDYGQIISDILMPKTPDPKNTLTKLIRAQAVTEDQARTLVNQGKLTAAIIIPADFSKSLNPTQDKPVQTTITLYRDAGSPLEAGIVSSVVRGLINNLTSTDIAIFAAKQQVTAGKASSTLLLQSQDIVNTMNSQIQAGAGMPIKITDTALNGQQTTNGNFNPLQYFAPSIAIFFVTFTAGFGANSIIEEQNTWTLQRMLSSPTTRTTILAGKLGGTFLNGVLQLSILIVATTLFGPLLGSTGSVWGSNILGIALVVICAVATATGLGTLIAGLARTTEQSGVYLNAILTLMGLVGGAFFDISTFGAGLTTASKLTLNYWATNGFSTLAKTGDIVSILPNLGALLLMFVIFFSAGVALFNRRLSQ